MSEAACDVLGIDHAYAVRLGPEGVTDDDRQEGPFRCSVTKDERAGEDQFAEGPLHEPTELLHLPRVRRRSQCSMDGLAIPASRPEVIDASLVGAVGMADQADRVRFGGADDLSRVCADDHLAAKRRE